MIDIADPYGDIPENSAAWPPKPNFPPLVDIATRQKLFGPLKYVASGTRTNPDAIQIMKPWADENIVFPGVPPLKQVAGIPRMAFHKKAAPQLVALWQAWEDAGLLDLITSWGGSWMQRFVRGSVTALSNHAFGTAFDINPGANSRGSVPALKGQPGSVRSLVMIANDHGFYWGGHWGGAYGGDGRQDGMHFEVAVLK